MLRLTGFALVIGGGVALWANWILVAGAVSIVGVLLCNK